MDYMPEKTEGLTEQSLSLIHILSQKALRNGFIIFGRRTIILRQNVIRKKRRIPL